MTRIVTLCSMAMLCSLLSFGQSKNCKLNEVVDEFSGKKHLSTERVSIFNKVYVLETMLSGIKKDAWWVSLAFHSSEEEQLQLCVSHEGVYTSLSPIEFIDIKFSDGSVVSLKQSKYGDVTRAKLLKKDHYDSFFSITKEQLESFTIKAIVKVRVKFIAIDDNSLVEKEVKAASAEKVKAQATCLWEKV